MSVYSDRKSSSQICDACIDCCCTCLSICLEKLKLKEKDGKYPSIGYKPPGRTRDTVEIPEFHQTPIPGRIFEFAQSRTPSDVAVHPNIVGGVITEQPGRMSRQRTPEYMDDTGIVVRRSQSLETRGEPLALHTTHLTAMKGSPRQDSGHRQQLGAESGGVPTPKLQFAVFYDFQQQSLTVDLQKASNLTIPEHEGLCSSFINIRLSPKMEMHSSQVVYNSSDPVYNESFKFLFLKAVQEQTLVFNVFHRSVFTRNELIGSVVLPLKDADLFATPIVMEIVKDDGKEDAHSTGDILLSLCYCCEEGTLGGIILKATNLHKPAWGLADPYVKVYLLHHGRRISKWRSNIKHHTLIPVFNESFKFDISTMDIKDLSLDVFVMNYERFKHNEIIGFVRIGASSASQGERNHWTEMLSAPNQQVSHWHQLQPQAELERKRSLTL